MIFLYAKISFNVLRVNQLESQAKGLIMVLLNKKGSGMSDDDNYEPIQLSKFITDLEIPADISARGGEPSSTPLCCSLYR